MIDNYNVYHYSKQEIFQLILKGSAFCIIFGILFYNNFLGILILLFFLPVYIKREKLNYIKKRNCIVADQHSCHNSHSHDITVEWV